jgi:hypothetical protein
VTEEDQAGAEQAAPAEEQSDGQSPAQGIGQPCEQAQQSEGVIHADQLVGPYDIKATEIAAHAVTLADLQDPPSQRDPLANLPNAIRQAVTYRNCHVNVARALPEVAKDDPDVVDALFEDGAIQRFKDEDRRTMQVVITPEGFAKQEV